MPNIINVESGRPIKAWTKDLPIDERAEKQLVQTAQLPFIHKWLAVMPDVHAGLGATIGSVIPTDKAIVPAAVGVDIGCGMMAVETSLVASDLPDSLKPVRHAIERTVPHGRTHRGGPGDRGAFSTLPATHAAGWTTLEDGWAKIVEKHPKLKRGTTEKHLGTLGTGNHFIEVCLDERGHVWVMLHSGSRGVGNRVGRYFIELAKKEMERWMIHLPNQDLAYLAEGSQYFDDYVEAVSWAQAFARTNRELMMAATLDAMHRCPELPAFTTDRMAVNCHHNYVEREHHYGKNVWVTRKGAVRARLGDLGIIPGSMGAKSFIVRGKGHEEAFCSCSHGAGRLMSRTAAKKHFTLDDHAKATEGVECRKDADVIDETPGAYKPIEKVMEAQAELVDIVHTLRQVVCVKG
ncbi:MAG: RtcB family protein [Deltaproteobacteria bacterium]|jgi:tRNA-splicing ligase RtcB